MFGRQADMFYIFDKEKAFRLITTTKKINEIYLNTLLNPFFWTPIDLNFRFLEKMLTFSEVIFMGTHFYVFN